jgi:hypothetical protein
MELKKNSCEEKLRITQVSYSFPFFFFFEKSSSVSVVWLGAVSDVTSFLTLLITRAHAPSPGCFSGGEVKDPWPERRWIGRP